MSVTQLKAERPIRVATHKQARVLDLQGNCFVAIVTNVSQNGFRLSSQEQLVAGEHINVCVDRYGEFNAQVRWADATDAGLVFTGS